MTSDPRERVFSDERIRRASLFNFAAGVLSAAVAGGVAVFCWWLLGEIVGATLALLIAAGVGLGLLWAAADWLSLGWFNRRLEQDLLTKLRNLGEITGSTSDPDVYFVGLAHPSRQTLARAETDDDIGFLTLTFDGLEYRGDRLHFDVPYEGIEQVQLVPVGYGMPRGVKRIKLTFRDGEPFDEIFLMAREGHRLSRGNDVTRTLYEAVGQRWERRAAVRLGAESDSTRASQDALG